MAGDGGGVSLRKKIVLVVACLGPLVLAGAGTPEASPRPPVSVRHSADGRVRGVPARFSHPGVVVSGAQLRFVRREVTAGHEPWKSAFAAMSRSRYADPGYTARPAEAVVCESNHGMPACVAEREDAIAAYTPGAVVVRHRQARARP